MRARHKKGSVVFNKKCKTWNYLWCENGHRRSKQIGTLREYPTKAAAWRVAEAIKASVERKLAGVVTVQDLAAQYESEKLPQRANAARSIAPGCTITFCRTGGVGR